MRNRLGRMLLACLAFLAIASSLAVLITPSQVVRAEPATAIKWTRQFSSSVSEIAVSSSGVYVSTGDSLRKFDADSNLLWTGDHGESVTADSSGVYVAGEEDWAGSPLRKYDANGSEMWTRLLGDEVHSYSASHMSAYSSDIYVGGIVWYLSSGDIGGEFVRKYDANGNVAWTRLLEWMWGDQGCMGVSACSTGIYVVVHRWGETTDTSGDFVYKYDTSGNEVWVRQIILSQSSSVSAISADASGVYVAVSTSNWDDGSSDASIRKYDANGSEVWVRQIVSSQSISASAVSSYAGGVYVAGSTTGTLTGQTSQGGVDAFVCEYDTDGNQVWIRQFGSSADDSATAISASANGIYLGGSTGGTMPNSLGTGSGFLSRLIVNEYPNQPVNVSPTNGAAKISVTPTLEGSVFADPDAGDTHVASRWQVRSSSGDYNSPVYDSGSTSNLNSIAVPSGELDYSTVYYWRVGYQDSRGAWSRYSKETSFSTTSGARVPPAVVTDTASGIGSTSATLNLLLTDLGSASSVQVSFEWGPGTDYGNTTTPQTRTDTESFSCTLSALSVATTYHFRAVAVGDGAGYGSVRAFTTGTAPATPPAVTTNAATGTAVDAATLNGALASLGSATSVQVSFEWGPTAAYGNTTTAEAMTASGSFLASLTGLTGNTTYHFRAKAVGDDTAYGDDLSFTAGTVATTPPAVTTGDADAITSDSARLNSNLTSLGTAASVTLSVLWGTIPGGPYTNETGGVAHTASVAFHFDLSGLSPGTTFYYQAKAVGDGTGYGGEKRFTTTGGAPVIGGVVADNGRPGNELTITINGAGLSGATGVGLGDGITVNEFRVVSDTEITAKIAIDKGAEPGKRDITVTTPWGTDTATRGFTVNDTGTGVHLWIYLVAVAGGLVGLGSLASLGVWMRRRSAG